MVRFEENFTLIKNMWVACNFYLRKVVKMILNDGSNLFLINIFASLHRMEIKLWCMESPPKTTSFALLKMECSKIELFRKSDKGLVFSTFQKWPKYRNSIEIFHFEENCILIKNLWAICDFYWGKVVKTI